GNDVIDGGAGNDRITGGRGYDTIDGGWGWDTAIYGGNRAEYVVSTQDNGITTVRHTGGGADNTDILSNIEVLQFADDNYYLA
ncbi:MAG: hypothetical protein ACK5M4_10940, partial [Pseudorhodobacter sp.]